MLDVISPCVTFNDHEGSTKSYAYAKDHDDPVEDVTFVPFFEDIAVDYEPGSSQEVTMHDGSKLYLKKLEEDYDPTDKINAMKRLHETARRGEFATGLIYIEPDRDDFLTQLNVVDEPLATLPLSRTRPGPGGARRDHGRPPIDCKLLSANCGFIDDCSLAVFADDEDRQQSRASAASPSIDVR